MFSHSGIQSAGAGVRDVGSVAVRGFDALWRRSRVGCPHQVATWRRNHGTSSTRRQRPLSRQAQFRAAISTAPGGQRRCVSSPANAFATLPEAAVKDHKRPIEEPVELNLSKPFPKTPSSTDPEMTSSEAVVAEEHKEPLFNGSPEAGSSSKPPADAPKAQQISITQEQIEGPLSSGVRSVMRTLSSSVVVITTTTSLPRAKDDPSLQLPVETRYRVFRGMTLSSLTTVTMSPEPIITFNIRSPSSVLTAISTCQHFLIHILDASPEGARIANHFTKRVGKTDGRVSTHGGVFRKGQRDEIYGIEMELVSHNASNGNFFALPRLHGVGVRKVLKCELLKKCRHVNQKFCVGDYGLSKPLLRIGDHMLVFARVVGIIDGSGELDETGYGLSYVDGKYRRVGDPISLDEYWPKHEDDGLKI